MKTSLLSPRALAVCLGIGSTLLFTEAQAANGPYVSVNLGAGISSLKKGGIDSAVGAQNVNVSSGSSDTQDTIYGFNLGYRLSPNFAFEGGYVNLGEYGYQSNTADPVAGAVTGHFKSYGFTAAGVGILPLVNKVSLYGKLGVVEAHTTLTAYGSPGINTSNVSYDSTGLLVGAGASYDITPQIATTLEWNRYGHLGNPGTAYAAVNTYTLGLKYKF